MRHNLEGVARRLVARAQLLEVVGRAGTLAEPAPGDARVVERVETRQAVACAEDCQAALEARAAGLGDVHEVQHRVAAARGERQPARERWRCAQRQ